MAFGAVRSISVRLLAEVSNYVHGIGRAKAATGDLITELSKSEQQRQNMQRLGTGLIVAGAGIAAGIGLATRAAINWESAWAGVVKTVDGSEAQLAALEDELREMARSLPATHAEIAAVAEAAGQLGVATGDVADFTETMIALGETTNLTADEAATSIAQLMNVLGTAPKDVDELASALVELGNNGASTEREIIQMAQRIAGAGAIIGASEADVLALSNALASAGIRVEAGGSAISRVMVDIASAVDEGGEKLEAFAEVAGVSADEFARQFARDPVSAINEFIIGLGRMNQAGQDVFGTLDELGLGGIRVRDSLLRLSASGDLLTQSLADGQRAWNENIALVEEAEKRYGTTAAQLQIARNQVNDFAIGMGQVFLPILGDVVSTVGSFVDVLGELPGPMKTALGVLAAVAAGVTLLGGAFLLAVPKIAATKAALDQLATSAGVTGTMARGLQRGLGAVPWGPLGLAVVGATTLITAYGVAQANARAKVKELSETLDEQTGAVTDNTRLWVANELAGRKATGMFTLNGRQLNDFADNLDRANVSMETAVDAVLGDAAALAELNTQLEEAKQREEELSGGLTLSTTERGKALTAAENQRESIEEIIEVIQDESDNVDKATKLQKLLAEGVGQTADEQENFAEQTQEATNRIREHADALREQTDPLFKLAQATQRVDQAQQHYNEVLDDTEATQSEVDQAALDLADSVLELQGAAGDAAGMFGGELTPAMRDTLESAGLTKKQINAIEDAFERATKKGDRFAKNYKATATFDIGPAVRSLEELNREIVRAGGQRAFRHGGVIAAQSGRLVPAHIATSPTVLYGERATGMEAFVPKHGSRSRSLRILDTAAGWYGASVVPDEDAHPGYVLTEDGSWVPRNFFDTAASIAKVTMPKPGFVLAEDDTWVPRSFHDTKRRNPAENPSRTGPRGQRAWDFYTSNGRSFARIFATGELIALGKMHEDEAFRHLRNIGKLDQGGWLPPGMSIVENATGQPERVLPPSGPWQWRGQRESTGGAAAGGDTGRINVERLEVTALTGTFSTKQVMDDLSFHGAV